MLSPSRVADFDQHPFEHQPHNYSLTNNIGNDPFGTGQRFDTRHPHPANNTNMTNGTGMVTGVGNNLQPGRPGLPQHSSNASSTYQATSPAFPIPSCRVLPTQRSDAYSPPTLELTESTQSLPQAGFNQASDHTGPVTARRSSTYYPHFRDSNGTENRPVVQQSTQFPGMESTFQSTQGHLSKANTSRLDPLAAPHYAGMPYGSRGTLSPMTIEYRSNLHSPYYSTTCTPPTGPESVRSTPASGASSRTSHNDQMLLDLKLRNLEAYHYDQSPFAMTSLQQQLHQMHHFDLPGHGLPVRLNPQAHPYAGPTYAQLNNYSTASRFPSRDPNHHAVRHPILEEWRMNSKTNKRLELKDIYSHVVEFSGDQNGSRFIQQKLETANSDEKEQVFKEIQPNLLQLMTDVYGNYVIQKMFEHGNQSQKKILANQMKGHVWTLSLQMYGCRVVQKAFEYVLTDQQASLVKELDGPNSQILKIVRDQNGNHVVQKAIERIPGEHIQFIVDAHRGQMMKMSTHQYGCRVVQRMLEHCQPKVKRVILDELLQNIQPLILDSYGNYVVQNIIQKGEPQDRRFIVNIVIKQLLGFSKHKFASNIVEKSIDFADQDQRVEILRQLTTPDEMGATPVLGLMRDQFGNYVLRK